MIDLRGQRTSVVSRILAMLLFVAGTFSSLDAAAQDAKPNKRVSEDLLQLAAPTANKTASKTSSDLLTGTAMEAPVKDGKVLIDAIPSGAVSALKADLKSLGIEGDVTYGRVSSGWLPIEAIESLENLSSLRYARPAYRKTSVGAVTSQGDVSMRTDEIRSVFGFDGTGMTIGVLSDTYDNAGIALVTDAAADVASGDLPGVGNPNGYTTPVNVLDDTGGPGIDEGRAMLQLVHDAAPGADLAFHTAFTGQAGFAQGILDLAAAGADVIVDDVIYFFEPMFQDGIIAQAADAVASAGIPYFSSAGNQARQSYESPFRDSGVDVGFLEYSSCGITNPAPILWGGRAHDFDPGAGVDIFQEFTINPGEGVGEPIILQWDQPFASVSGTGSTNDYDMYLVLTDDGGLGFSTPCVLQSGTAGNIGGDPVEGMNGIGLGPAATTSVKVAIMILEYEQNSGSAGLLKYVTYGGNAPDEYDTKSGTSYGHANAAGAEGVGAAWYVDTPEFGQNPPLVEGFSSAGGVPTLFDVAGNPISEVRLNPGITAPDGTNTTFFLGSDPESDGFQNFFGTSAAAPHAAAAAALVLQADPSLTPAQVYSVLRNHAIDMDDPYTAGFDAGFDFGTGYGLIDAYASVKSLVVGSCDPADDAYWDGQVTTLGSDKYLRLVAPRGWASIDFWGTSNLSVDGIYDASGNDIGASFNRTGDRFDYVSGGPYTEVLVKVSPINAGGSQFYIKLTDLGRDCPVVDVDPVLALQTGIDDEAPLEFSVLPNYPNPFSRSTTIGYTLPESADVTLTVIDLLGREVITIDEGRKTAGTWQVSLDSDQLSSGVYLYRLKAGDNVETRRMMLRK